MIHLIPGNSSSLWKSIPLAWKHRARWLYLGRFVFFWPLTHALFSYQITYGGMSNFLCIWLLEMSLLSFKDTCWLSQHHRYFFKDELRIPWQSISPINKYLLTSGSILFLSLLRYSVHIMESFYWTEFYFNWIKAFLYDSEIYKQYGWSENLLKTFYQRKSSFFWWSGKQMVLIGTLMWQ